MSEARPPGAAAIARMFSGLSRWRGKRIFHPNGVGFAARLTPIGGSRTGATALDAPSEPVVRLSRALGLPEPLPDPCGLAIRVPDAHGRGRHQDFLLVSSGQAPLARHMILPARGFLDRPYSSLLPYRLNGKLVVLVARGVGDDGRGPLLEELRERELGGLEFELGTATLTGKWRPVAQLALGECLPADETERLAFDPTNTGGGLELAWWLNRLRGPSYRASQEGRASSG
ncbi:MAG TPA: hypothetical protein VFY04_05500 [Solirubrobacterales bacterium]|nr:hypothetical protein [Solirubrobacterales bacterium]